MSKIYLISPPKIALKTFSLELEKSLKTGLVPVFQLRLKDCPESEIKKSAQELQKICRANNCLFLLNDSYDMALEIGADGVHLGVEDGSIKIARQKSQKINPGFVIGASCYDSKHLVMEAGEQGADYVSFGAFFESKTKQSRGKPTAEIIAWCNDFVNLPITVIGGINDQNCVPLVKAGADFIAVISYVWDHPASVVEAIKKLNFAIQNSF